jgi:hypothetical protein
MEITEITTDYQAKADPRGWYSLKITQESDSEPTILFRAALDDAVTAVQVAEFIQSVADVHHDKHGINITEKAATSALEFFGHVAKRGETNRL